MVLGVYCNNCGSPYPSEGVPYRCPKCGGIYQIKSLPQFVTQPEHNSKGIWSWLDPNCLGISENLITLGEGNTPLLKDAVKIKDHNWEVYYKCEYQNPTGSFKDRGSAVMITFLNDRGIKNVYEDSSGNAGASLAAYAARAGIKANIYIPKQASGIKKAQIKQYGANTIVVDGARSTVNEVLQNDLSRDRSSKSSYASHAYLPFNLFGYATIAVEILEQLGKEPGTVILPAGQGGGLLGVYYGFKTLYEERRITHIPSFIGVQAQACAPLWATYNYGPNGLSWVAEGDTIAEGIRIKYPVRGDEVLQAIKNSGGRIYAVNDEEIIQAGINLTQRGLLVEPTSAVVEAVLQKHVHEFNPPVVAILTGSGLKTPEAYD